MGRGAHPFGSRLSRRGVFALYELEGLRVGRTVVSASYVKQAFTSLRVALTDRLVAMAGTVKSFFEATSS